MRTCGASWTATATRSRPKGRRRKSRARTSRGPRTRTYGRRAGSSGAAPPPYGFAILTDGRLTVGLRWDRAVRLLGRHGGQARLPFEHGAALAAEGVGGEHGVDEHGGMDLEGHVVDGLAFDARGLGDPLELLAAHAFEPYVFQGDRETDLQAEVHDLLDHEHGNPPEGHLLPVPVVVGALQSS